MNNSFSLFGLQCQKITRPPRLVICSSSSTVDNETRSPPSPIKLAIAAESANHPTVDNYNLDNNNDFTLSEKVVHCIGRHVTPEYWLACKACIVFMAGCMVCELTPMSKAAM